MEIHINDLKAAVKRLKKVVPTRSTKPILENVRILSLSPITAIIAGTNLEIGIRLEMPIMRGDYENFIVPLKTLEALSKRKNTDWYIVTHEDNQVSFQAGTFKKSVKVDSVEDFPNLPTFSNEWQNLPDTFTRTLKESSIFAASNRDRYAINSILIDKDYIVGCNGKWLSRFACQTDISKQILVPTNLSKVIEDKEVFKFSVSKQHIFLRSMDDKITIAAMLVEGNYPNYNDVIPQLGNKVLFDNNNALVAMDDIKDTADNGIDAVSSIRPMEITVNGNIRFYSKNPIEEQETENILACQYSGEAINIRLDWNLLQPILKNFPAFQLHLKNDNSPVVFANNKDRIVLMPLYKG